LPPNAGNSRPQGGTAPASDAVAGGCSQHQDACAYPLLDTIEKSRGQDESAPAEILFPAKHAERIKRFAIARQRALEMSGHISGALSSLPRVEVRRARKVAHRMSGCGSFLAFEHYYTVGKLRLVRTERCRNHMLCPSCAIIRAGQMIRRYMERAETVFGTNPHLCAYFLTLTVRNGADLQERMQHLKRSWDALMQKRRDYMRGKGFGCFLNDASGGIISFEITNNGDGWHPHIHALLFAEDGALPDIAGLSAVEKQKSRISREWAGITGDSFIVDCRRVYLNQRKDLKSELLSAFLEVFKYVLKFSELSIEDNFYAWREFRGKHFTRSFGCMYGVKVPTTDQMEVESADLPYIERVYKYDPSQTDYRLQSERKAVCKKSVRNGYTLYDRNGVVERIRNKEK
jgi:plasmid rolling circle replication initiator protein Rep